MTSDLIKRISEAERGSRDLDISVGQALGLIDADLIYTYPDGTRGARGNCDPWPTWTVSLDAALALVERELPGWCFAMATITPPWVQAYPPGSVEDCLDAVAANTLPLALVAALLRSQARDDAGGGE